LAVLLLNVRRSIKGHQLVSIGTQDTILVHLAAHSLPASSVLTTPQVEKGQAAENGRRIQEAIPLIFI
jgi:hypothetical protein